MSDSDDSPPSKKTRPTPRQSIFDKSNKICRVKPAAERVSECGSSSAELSSPGIDRSQISPLSSPQSSQVDISRISIKTRSIGIQTSPSLNKDSKQRVVLEAIDNAKETIITEIKKSSRSQKYDTNKKFETLHSNLAVNSGLANLHTDHSTELMTLGMAIPCESIEDFEMFENLMKTDAEKRKLVVSIYYSFPNNLFLRELLT